MRKDAIEALVARVKELDAVIGTCTDDHTARQRHSYVGTCEICASNQASDLLDVAKQLADAVAALAADAERLEKYDALAKSAAHVEANLEGQVAIHWNMNRQGEICRELVAIDAARASDAARGGEAG